mmetsp:Transcript_42644/g.117641  ORF Transcript_42644/g.117641 Transcript_42644/m.117641 type:complete len:157 (-) Transcript_42644:16-486(-)
MRVHLALMFVGLVAIISSVKAGEDTDDIEDFDMGDPDDDNDENAEEFEKLEDELEELQEDEDSVDEGNDHPLFEPCKARAEELEKEIGLFDDGSMEPEARTKLAKKLAEHAEEITEKKGTGYFEKVLAHLAETQASSNPWGAMDACRHLLEHHGEL